MTFKLFKKTSEVHFDHGGIDDYDGDTGYEIDYEVSCKELNRALADIIADEYFAPMSKQEREKIVKGISALLNDTDLDTDDDFVDAYYYELTEYFQRKIIGD